MTKRILLFLIILLCLPFINAQDSQVYHLKLLAVQEDTQGNYQGSDADLYLELKEGTGRVFLDTYPLTKIDTQISTRFAKEIACKHYHLDCDKYDFIYTIKAKSSIIGGPSAGGAIAALTTIAVMDLPYRQDIAVTGTINSGATIGPVGGLKEKIEAAQKAGMNLVLIPKGTAKQELNEKPLEDDSAEAIERNNSSSASGKIDLIKYASEELRLEVQEVSDLDETLFTLTGRELRPNGVKISVSGEYQGIMENLSRILCDRTVKIEKDIQDEGIILNESIINSSNEKKELSQNSSEQGNFYSSASYCFGNNILLKYSFYQEINLKMETINTLFSYLQEKNQALQEQIDQEEIQTISALQAVMVVKERINDVQQQTDLFQENKANYSMEEIYSLLAYSEERYFSALSWYEFVNMPGKKYILDAQQLSGSCIQKISEARERYQYVNLYLDKSYLENLQKRIGWAEEAQNQQEFALCLMQATQAKAEADAILSSAGLGEENLPDFLTSKNKAVEKVIAENTAEGVFPILGYSYYQYAQSLEKSQPFNALVYYEYALEMSDISLYFEETIPKKSSNSWFSPKQAEFFIVGFLSGLGVAGVILLIRKIIVKSRKDKP